MKCVVVGVNILVSIDFNLYTQMPCKSSTLNYKEVCTLLLIILVNKDGLSQLISLLKTGFVFIVFTSILSRLLSFLKTIIKALVARFR